MCNNNEFYFCEHCGNLIEMIHDAGVSVVCCGEKMKRIEPGVVEASQDKHLPVVSVSDSFIIAYRKRKYKGFKISHTLAFFVPL